MGIYDRDYAQSGAPPNLAQRFSQSSMTVKIVIVTIGIYLVDNLFLGTKVTDLFAVNAGLFTEHWNLWQLLTYGFAHAPMNETIMHIAGNMYGLWFFGRDVEKRYGSREFLALYLAIIVLSGLVWCGIKLLTAGAVKPGMLGASGAISGIIVIYALSFPDRKLMLMFLPVAMPAWVLGLIIVGSDVIGAMGLRGDGIAFVAHLAGAGLGAAYFYSGMRLLGDGEGFGFKMPKVRSGPKLKVHRPQDENLDRKADKILEKISREGADSVTNAERKILEEYSRRMRNRRG